MGAVLAQGAAGEIQGALPALDYIDRGPKSRGVLDRLLENPFPGDYVALKGNHEVLLEAFLADPKAGVHWQHLGGMETCIRSASASPR